jgi:CBS domain-containing protein
MGTKDSVRSVLHDKGRSVYHVAPETPVYEALEVMARHDIGALPVISGAGLCGVFSERDYARKVILQGKASRETPVGDIMTSPAIVAHPEQTVDDCLHLMTKFRVRHLPVLERGSVTGVVSIGDLVNWIIHRQEHEIEQLNHYIAGSYPA